MKLLKKLLININFVIKLMYTSKKPENIQDYELIKVDNKIFYHKKDYQKSLSKPKRRYSDQFKDPAFKLKDENRKLKMMKQFYSNHGNIQDLTEKYKECIAECISILNSDFDIPSSSIFNHFNLKNYGFDPEEYGVEEDENSIEEKEKDDDHEDKLQ